MKKTARERCEELVRNGQPRIDEEGRYVLPTEIMVGPEWAANPQAENIRAALTENDMCSQITPLDYASFIESEEYMSTHSTEKDSERMNEEWRKFGAEKMGKVILVSKTVDTEVQSNDNGCDQRVLTEFKLFEPRAGWVVGYRDRKFGELKPGGFEFPGELVEKGRLRVVQVVFWPNMSPTDVPLDGFEYPTDKEPMSPSAWSMYLFQKHAPKGYERYCQQTREAMELVPRNKKGEWK